MTKKKASEMDSIEVAASFSGIVNRSGWVFELISLHVERKESA
jgi:hypothetical protein